jgi:flagellar hook assembly protein FlgD
VSTQIRYALPEEAEVIIEVFNILGQKVRVYNLGRQTAGYKSVVWDGKSESGKQVSSGIYLYRIKAGRFVECRRMTLLK